jgi:hypothetical protein
VTFSGSGFFTSDINCTVSAEASPSSCTISDGHVSGYFILYTTLTPGSYKEDRL